jgi:hypothetical protein
MTSSLQDSTELPPTLVAEIVLDYDNAKRLATNDDSFPTEIFGGIPRSRIPMDDIADLVKRLSELDSVRVRSIVIKFASNGDTEMDVILDNPSSRASWGHHVGAIDCIGVPRPRRRGHPVLL